MIKRYVLALLLGVVNYFSFAQTPLSENGKLKLVGNQLSNECGYPVQLRGISTHGPEWFQSCYSESSVRSIAQDWGADVLRLALYTDVDGDQYGYVNNDKTYWDAWIDRMVGYAEDNGMYCIIDWHILDDRNPNWNINDAKTFFGNMSEKYKNKKHVIYEICNEPNGSTTWDNIRTYAEQIIPIIRANDPENIIIVGSPEWSSKPGDALNNPLSTANQYNVMYTFHFYAGSHFEYDYLKQVADRLPIFVTEWGTTHSSGNGSYNASSSNTWLDILDGNNEGGQLISSCNWAFADKNETSSSLQSGSCASQSWLNRTTSGDYVYNYVSSSDNFTTCVVNADDDNDGVINTSDLCANTPNGAAVDADGCEIVIPTDSDDDGVLDDVDECPGTTPGTVVNYKGCEFVDDVLNVGNAAVDPFDQTGFVESSSGYAGLFWWSGNSSVYTLTRSTNGMTVSMNNADVNYATFGVAFGDGGKYIDLEEFSNADINLNLTNNTSKDIFITIGIQDADGNQAEIVPDDPFNITWDNKWQKIGVSVSPGQTVDETIDLSSISDKIGGYTPASWGCATAVDCPTVSYDLDPSRITTIVFIVNGGAGTTDNPDYDPVTGDLVFNHFSIGDVTKTLVGTKAVPIDEGDDDSDNVINEYDLCPNTPTGETVDSKGCSDSQLDTDKDGVNDDIDLCSGTAIGTSVDADGCPQGSLDSDNDGVYDVIDDCPNTASGVTVDSKGCEAVSTGISELNLLGVSLYPNPTNNTLFIDQSQFDFSSVTVSDITGQVVLNKDISSLSERLDMSQLSKGVYMIRLEGNGKTVVSKVVVQ